MRDSCNPVWEENNVFDFPIEVVQGQELLLELYDDDDRGGAILGRPRQLQTWEPSRNALIFTIFDIRNLVDSSAGDIAM